MKNKLLSKILGVGVAASTVIALGGAFLASPAAADTTKWTTINTPSQEDYVIVPGADIYDYAVGGEDGSIVYAVGEINPIDGMFDIDFTAGGLVIEATGDEAVVAITIDADGTVSGLDGVYYGEATIGDVLTGLYGQISFTATITDNDPGPDTVHMEGYLYVDPTDAGQVALLAALVSASPIDVQEGTACIDDWDLEWNTGTVALTDGSLGVPKVWKSTDGGVTWDDITDDVMDADNLPGPFMWLMNGGVAVAPDDEEWVAICGEVYTESDPQAVAVVATKDGGDNWDYAGDLEDTGSDTMMVWPFDIDVS
ncbi:MAG: sialidase family protein, partial [Dehalococcoidales bacterium]|nr:sialidase family protein [Dehalococcoidales bacterium]